MTAPDDTPPPPDGPTPAREQLPLPRRRRQTHLEPQLRTPGGAGTGTPFAPFGADPGTENTRGLGGDRCEQRSRPADRAAAFHAGVHRGRGERRRAERQ